MMKGLILDVIAVTALKSAVGRTRPDGSDTRSFPSGHTSGAFTISTILSRRHGWKVGIPAFGLATFTAIARMEDNRHYFSDVVAGAAIGIAVGQLVTPKAGDDGRGVQVIAGPSKVALRMKF
jgi:membrane-associated phospholipid phosphatase